MKLYDLLHPELLIFKDHTSHRTFFVDTGSSHTLGLQQDRWMGFPLLAPLSIEFSKMLFSTAQAMLAQQIGLTVDYILGLDLLSQLSIYIDLKNRLIGFSSKPTAVKEGFTDICSRYEVSNFLGHTNHILMLNARIHQKDFNMIFDTGAHIGYSCETLSHTINPILTHDFNPILGNFDTPVSEFPLEIFTTDQQVILFNGVKIGDLSQIQQVQHAGLVKSFIQNILMLKGDLVVGYGISHLYPMFITSSTDGVDPIKLKLSSKLHDDFALIYDASYIDLFGSHFHDITQALIDELASHLPTTGRFLDLGAGTGRISIPLLEKGYDITVIEPNPTMHHILFQKLNALNQPSLLAHLNSYLGTLTQDLVDEFLGEPYDMIFLGMGVIDYFTPEALAAFHLLIPQILKKDGYLVIQPTPLHFYQNATLQGTRYQRKLTFQPLGGNCYQLTHQGIEHQTQKQFEEQLIYYSYEAQLKEGQLLSLFELKKTSFDGAYPSYYFMLKAQNQPNT